MIVVKIMGGLGNQLQQYAVYKKFKTLGVEAKVDISWFSKENQENMLAKRDLELNYFEGIEYEAATEEEIAKLIGSDKLSGKLRRKLLPFTINRFDESMMYHPELLKMQSAYISGYFACEKYYADILPLLRNEIKFPIGMEKAEVFHKIAADMDEVQSVALHLRRGDYLDAENQAMFGGICTEEYYEGAINHLMQKVEAPVFFIFSDDSEYAEEYAEKMRQKFGVMAHVLDMNKGKASFLDIYLMSKCKHIITANSTFSFWGARFNDYENKIMIRPTKHKNSQKFVRDEMVNLWKEWTFVDPNGTVVI